MSVFDDQLQKIKTTIGFIAALDQSGGSTPKALKAYDVSEDEYADDAEMFDLVHAMRTRIVTDASFTGARLMGAILFEDTLNREIKGMPSSEFLWQKKNIVPFLKVDKGLHPEENGVQLMKDMPGLDEVLVKAKAKSVFGTKMRSVIKSANAQGIEENVAQQFEIGRQIIGHGLVPILEPEVDIHAADKSDIEELLKASLLKHLDTLSGDQMVMLKLTLPDNGNFYKECIQHPRVLKVVALSGGYNRETANEKLSGNAGMIASFSRGLTEGLSAKQNDKEFNAKLDEAIESIYQASLT